MLSDMKNVMVIEALQTIASLRAFDVIAAILLSARASRITKFKALPTFAIHYDGSKKEDERILHQPVVNR
jgi:hypothetical protein